MICEKNYEGSSAAIKYLLAVIFALALTGGAQAKTITQNVAYQQDGTVLQGYLAYDDAVKGPRPGVLVVHEWWGLNDYAKMRARQLAEMGYVAQAAARSWKQMQVFFQEIFSNGR